MLHIVRTPISPDSCTPWLAMNFFLEGFGIFDENHGCKTSAKFDLAIPVGVMCENNRVSL